jgi:hypothetical protein
MPAWWRRSRQEEPAAGPPQPAPASPLLPGLKSALDALLDQEDQLDAEFTEEQERARQQAARNFRESGPGLLAGATAYLWEYYRATTDEFTPEQCRDYGIPLLPPETDIWTQVSITTPPNIEIGGTTLEPAAAYISFEGEVSWEPEHGLQWVIEDGLRVCKVGSYDGRRMAVGDRADDQARVRCRAS